MAVKNSTEWLDTIRTLKKTGRSKKKRHGVNKRRSHTQRAKTTAVKLKVQADLARYRRLQQSIREYWAGERAEHP
jgi:hypothetical protein